MAKLVQLTDRQAEELVNAVEWALANERSLLIVDADSTASQPQVAVYEMRTSETLYYRSNRRPAVRTRVS